MMDSELDELLAAHQTTISPEVVLAVDELVTRTRLQAGSQPVKRPWRRRRVVWAGVAGSALVLTGAAGWLSAEQLRTPPFSTIPDRVQRLEPAVPVDYTTVDNEQVHCQAFLEFQHLDLAQVDAVQAYLTGRDWTGFGQTVYDRAAARLPAASRTSEQVNQELGEVLDPALGKAVTGAVSSVRFRGFGKGQPTYNGYAMTCGTGQR